MFVVGGNIVAMCLVLTRSLCLPTCHDASPCLSLFVPCSSLFVSPGTGSHGSSLYHGTLSDAVVGVTAVALTDGSLVVYDERGDKTTVVVGDVDVVEDVEEGGDCRDSRDDTGRMCKAVGGVGDSGEEGNEKCVALTGERDTTESRILPLLRCALGQAAVLCEVSLQVQPQRCFVRKEVAMCVDERDAFVVDIAALLGDRVNEHVWVQWRLGTGSNNSGGKAIAICLRRCDDESVRQRDT